MWLCCLCMNLPGRLAELHYLFILLSQGTAAKDVEKKTKLNMSSLQPFLPLFLQTPEWLQFSVSTKLLNAHYTKLVGHYKVAFRLAGEIRLQLPFSSARLEVDGSVII